MAARSLAVCALIGTAQALTVSPKPTSTAQTSLSESPHPFLNFLTRIRALLCSAMNRGTAAAPQLCSVMHRAQLPQGACARAQLPRHSSAP